MSTKSTQFIKKAISTTLALSMAFALVAVTALSAFAVDEPTLSPSSAVLSENGTAKVSFVVDEAVALAGAKVVVEYTATDLTPTKVVMGDSFAGLMANNVDSSPDGALVIVFAQSADAEYAEGDIVFTVWFTVKALEKETTGISVNIEQAADAELKDVDLEGGSEEYTIAEEVKELALDEDDDSGLSLNRDEDDETSTATLTNISPSYSLADLLLLLDEALTVTENVINSENKSDAAVAAGYAATGDVVQLIVGDVVVDEVTLVVNGDVDGTGEVNSTDILAVQSNVLKEILLTDVYLEAGTLNGYVAESNVILALQNHILKFALL